MNPDRHLLDREFTMRLIRIARVYRKEVDRTLSAYGISDAQAVPVLHIARLGGGVRQRVLADEIGIEGPSLVRLLDQLCAHGLTERRSDPQDARAKRVRLTAAGTELAGRVEAALDQIRARLLQPVSDDDLAAALRVLAILHDGLGIADAHAGAGVE